MVAEPLTHTLSPVAVERACAANHAELLALYRGFEPKAEALGLPPLREEDTRAWLASIAAFPNFVARSGDRLIGHAVVCPERDTGEVAVFVHQDFRGQGAGRMLLSELVAEASRLGLRRIWGIAAADNVPMLRLAHSCGFLPGEELGEFYLLLP